VLKRFLFLGLGNPGAKYRGTRHNLGFEWIDALAKSWSPNQSFKEAFKSLWLKFDRESWEVHLLKPQTFMNLSGQALQSWRTKYQGDFSICVFLDDLDLPLGRLRFRAQGGDGGHRGLRSVIEVMGHQEFQRLRIGVGRELEGVDVKDYVLENFSATEKSAVEKILFQAPDFSDLILLGSMDRAMNVINSFEVK
jgi:PTH1 family peptidyl-tRNA hydrolase